MTTVDPAAFKAAAGSFGTGVTIVTSNQNGQVYGMTVSAFASLSIEPMQIIVSLRTGSLLQDMIFDSNNFAVSILREDQKEVAAYFATSGREPCDGKFPGLRCSTAVSGAPIIGGPGWHGSWNKNTNKIVIRSFNISEGHIQSKAATHEH